MQHKAFLNWLKELFPECWDEDIRKQNPNRRCYMLDEGGFIVASSLLTSQSVQNDPRTLLAAKMQVHN